MIINWLEAFSHLLFSGVRITSVFVSALVFSAQFVSVKVRLSLGLACTIALFPILPELPQNLPPIFSILGMGIVLQQMIIGVVIGLLTQWIAQGFVLLGQIVAMQSSLGFSAMVDPSSGQSSSVLSQWYQWFAIMTFLAMDGHLVLVRALHQSFISMPVGAFPEANTFWLLAVGFQSIVALSINLSVALMLSLLIVNVLFGVLSRVSPQVNVFSLGFSAVLLFGLFLVAVTLPSLSLLFDALWEKVWGFIQLWMTNGR